MKVKVKPHSSLISIQSKLHKDYALNETLSIVQIIKILEGKEFHHCRLRIAISPDSIEQVSTFLLQTTNFRSIATRSNIEIEQEIVLKTNQGQAKSIEQD